MLLFCVSACLAVDPILLVPVLPYHIAQLRSICQTHPAGRKVVFVPSRQIGYNLGNALAAAGCSWANLYLTTPSDWAERLAGPRLRADGWRPIAQGADLFIVQSLLGKITWPEGHSFAAGVTSSGVAKAYLSSIRALRGAGVESSTLADSRVRSRSVLASIYREYSAWLADGRYYDQTHLFEEAARLGEREEHAAVAVVDELPLTRAGFKFVDVLSRGTIVRIGRRAYKAALPQHCAGRRFHSAPLVDHGVADDPPVNGEAGPKTVELREAIGTENEIRGVLRELLRSDVPLDTVEIAYTSEDPYLSLLTDTADRFDLPMTSAAGIPVTCTCSGQALLSFYRWIAGGFDPADLIALLRSRLIETRAAYRINPEKIGHLLEESRIGRGPTAYKTALSRFEKRILARRSAHAESETPRAVAASRRSRKALDDLTALCPSGGTVSLRRICETGIRFLDAFAPKRSERDKKSAESLRDRLLDLAEETRIEAPPSELTSLLLELLADHKVEASVAEAGHVYVVPLERAGYCGREHQIIVGMAETTFPGVSIEDPILLDDERRQLSGDLMLERTRSSESVWHFERALSMRSGRVMLVSTRRGLADGRETYPSAVFQEYAARTDSAGMRTYFPAPAADEALDSSELALAARAVPDLRVQVEHERPWLSHGMAAERERASKAIGRFDGWLPDATSEFRPGGDEVMSASRLEDLAACPHRYFLKHVLKVRPPEAPSEEPGRWLTPLEFGSLLHDVLREFMQTLADRGERVADDRHAALLEEILESHIERMREEVPVKWDAAYRADRARLRRGLRIFLHEESRRNVEPVGFEVSFGLGRTDGLSRAEPVELRLSDRVRLALRGSIDRVDRTPDGFEVWDYKSGSSFDFDEADLLTAGRRLQWALYAYALEQILEEEGENARVVRAGYFFTNDREHGLRLGDRPPRREAVAERIEPLFDLVTAGGFLHIQKSKACTFCDYRPVCSSERRDGRDMDDILDASPEDSPFLEALQRWMSDD